MDRIGASVRAFAVPVKINFLFPVRKHVCVCSCALTDVNLCNLWQSACSGQAATAELFDISGDADEKDEGLTLGQVAVDKIVAPKLVQGHYRQRNCFIVGAPSKDIIAAGIFDDLDDLQLHHPSQAEQVKSHESHSTHGI